MVQTAAANYTAAVGLDDGRVVLRDADTGDEVRFTASVVVNATGPWVDLTNAELREPTRYMGGTKGSHIVLDHPELLAATGGRELFFEHRDGRIVLIYPLKGRVLVGTTDLEHDMADPIVESGANVYQYVGDEVVVTWEIERGLKNADCIRYFFAVEESLARRRQIYLDTYGATPTLRGALHIGPLMVGEIGGSDEEAGAEFIRQHVTKPVVAYIAGVTAPPGKRMGHAGAVIAGGKGTAADKFRALEAAGVRTVRSPAELGSAIEEQLRKRRKA